jgi:hypothetical protein
MALKMVGCILLLEITAFLRETFRNLPRSQRPAPGPVARLDPRQSQSHGWGEGMPPGPGYSRGSNRDYSHLNTPGKFGHTFDLFKDIFKKLISLKGCKLR